MKKILISFAFLFLFCLKAQAQATVYVCEGENSYKEVSATSITVSADGTTFYCNGNVTITNIGNPDPDDGGAPKPKCGGNTGWVCGVVTITTEGDITTVRCVGSSGRCAKVVSPN
jgi:hypothetical protein